MIGTLPTTIAATIAHFTGRVWMLPKLLTWLEQSSDQLCLLTGEPGTGKSALIAWLAGAGPVPPDTAAQSQLARIRAQSKAVHFCQANSGSTAPKALAQNMAQQLVHTVPGFSDALAISLADRVQIAPIQHVGTVQSGGRVTGVSIERLDLGTLGDEMSFDRTIREPLQQLYATGYDKPLLLLVDALDEAMLYTDSINIPRLLVKLDDLPPQVRILATTRSDPRVLKLYQNAKRFDLIDDAPADADDVGVYVHNSLAGLDTARCDALTDRIAHAAEGNFLYTHLVLGDLLPRLPMFHDLAELALPKGLRGVYHDFLNRELGVDEDRWYEIFKPLLGVIAVAQGDGLSRPQLQAIVGKEDIERTMRTCKQYLDGELPDGPFRLFHKSLADYLLEDDQNIDYHIDEIAMHQRVSDYFFSVWGGLENGLPGLPVSAKDSNGVYGLRHLVFHLESAGRQVELDRLLALDTAARQNLWYTAKSAVNDIGGFVRDVTRAWQLAERIVTHDDPAPCQNLDLQNRYALVSASINSQIGHISPQLLAALVEKNEWAPLEALDYLMGLNDSGRRAEGIAALAAYLQEDSATYALQLVESLLPRDQVTALPPLFPQLSERSRLKAWAMIRAMENDELRANAIAQLASKLAEPLVRDALRMNPVSQDLYLPILLTIRLAELGPAQEALQLARGIADPYYRTQALMRIQSHLLPSDQLAVVFEAFAAAQAIKDSNMRLFAIALMAEFLPEDLLNVGVAQARQSEDMWARGVALAQFANYVAMPSQENLLRESLIALATTQQSTREIPELQGQSGVFKSIDKTGILRGAVILEAAGLRILQTRTIDYEQAQERIFTRLDLATVMGLLALRLPESLLGEALSNVWSIQCREGVRAEEWTGALAALAPQLTEALLESALDQVRTFNKGSAQVQGLGTLAPYLNMPLLLEAWTFAQQMKEPQCRAQASASLAPHLPASEQDNAWQQSIDAAQATTSDWERVYALQGIAQGLPGALMPEALNLALGLHANSAQASALATLVPYMTSPLLEEAVRIARGITRDTSRTEAFSALSLRYAELGNIGAAMALAQSIKGIEDREKTLAGIVTRLQELGAVKEALACTQSIADADEQARTLVALAPHLPEALLADALNSLRAMPDSESQIEALRTLGPYLTDTLLHEALTLVPTLERKKPLIAELERGETLDDRDERAEALAALASYLNESLLTEALAIALGLPIACEFGRSPRAQGIAALCSYLPLSLLHEVFDSVNTIPDPHSQVYVLSSLLPRLAQHGHAAEALAIAKNITIIPAQAQLVIVPLIYPSEITGNQSAGSESPIITPVGIETPPLLASLGPYLTGELLNEAITAAQSIPEGTYRASTLSRLALRLSEFDSTKALEITETISPNYSLT